MVKRILRLFNAEFSGLHKAALVLAISSIISAIFGLFRDRLLAGAFGASQSLDIYYAAFKIPDLIYVASLFLVSVNTIIPLLLEKVSLSKGEAKRFLDNIFSFFLFIIFLLTVAAFFVIPYLTELTAPGFSGEAKGQLIMITRVLLLSPLFLGLSNLISSVIQSYNKFFIYALSPIFYNLGIIAGIVFLLPVWGIKGIAAGVIVGAFLHFSIQIPSILKLGLLPRLDFRFNFKEIGKVAMLSFPRALGLGINQIILIFITATASLVGSGSIAIFNLSFNLQSVPLAVIGMSFSVAAFPTMSNLFVNNKRKEFIEHAAVALRQIVFWSIPASALIIVLRAQIVRVIFGSGRFGWNDTRLTAAALAIFAFSITAQSIIVLLVRSFYASGKTWRPIAVNMVSAVLIIGAVPLLIKIFKGYGFFTAFFSNVLRIDNADGAMMLALPSAFSAGMIVNALILIYMFEKEFGGIVFSTRKTFIDVIGASLIMSFVSYVFLRFLDDVFNINTFVGISSQGFISALAGVAAFIFVLRSARNKELGEISVSLKNKFWRTPVVAPEPEAIEKQ